MDIEQEILNYGVSRETLQKIKDFVTILQEWNGKINLVSKNSIKDVWVRHVLDSVQLIKYIPQKTTHLVDIGSGSGFPGICLAILMQELLPQAKITLVESITKKTVYLNDVIQKLGLANASVMNLRVENGVFKNVSVITARAVTDLNTLILYQNKIGDEKTIGLYLKGEKYKEELVCAEKNWHFKLRETPNKYAENGIILQITEVRKKK